MKCRIVFCLMLVVLFSTSARDSYAATAARRRLPAVQPPASLPLKAAPCPTGTGLEMLLDPRADAWGAAPGQPIKLNRTPPLYEGDPSDDGQRPAAAVQLLRLGDNMLLVRCHWTDASEDVAKGGALFVDAGQEHIYKEHTTATDQFPDAFCVMLPKTRGPQSTYPPLMMGGSESPVDLYFWRAGKGFEYLNAHGRSTTGPVKEDAGAKAAPPQQGQAVREGDGWSVVMAVPNVTRQTPLCFAIWDGVKMHRDGLKFFSLWYEVE